MSGAPEPRAGVSGQKPMARAFVRAWDVPCVALIILVAVVLLQYAANAYSVAFIDDDASHYVSGLLIHDYLRHGLGQSPIPFLIRFYDHYPLVGIGHWAPGYYVVVALWMLLAGISLHGTLVLSALVTTAVATLVYVLLRNRTGHAVALFGALGFVASPIIQNGSMELMLDIPMALMTLLAAMTYARFLRSGTAWSALLFGLLASAAIMIKGNGAALALLPPIAVLVTGRWTLPRDWRFWLPVPIVLVMAGPWYALTYGHIADGFRYAWGLSYALVALRANSVILFQGVGPLVLALAGWGIVDMWRGRRSDPTLAALLSLLVGVWVFQMVAPAAIQDRYLAPLLAPLLVFAGLGVFAASRLIFRGLRSRGLGGAALACVALASMVPSALSANYLPNDGYLAAARAVRQLARPENPTVLVVAPATGESAMISALAAVDPARPSFFVVRGVRLLGGGGYNNDDYVPRFSEVGDVIAAIDRYAIPLLVFRGDRSPRAWAHIGQVREALRREGKEWEIVARAGPADDPVLIVRLHENDHRRTDVRALEKLSAPRGLQ